MKLIDYTTGLRARGEKALVPFFTAGYPDEETFCDVVRAAAAAGCSVMEIGIPFSDPMADGPVIQESSRVALAGGMTLCRALELTTALASEVDVGFVFMSYINPILRMGFGPYAARARAAGVRGTIIPDLPVEEAADIRAAFAGDGIALVDLVAPTSGEARIRRIAAEADGFLYLVSLTGVTGVRSHVSRDLGGFVARVRAHTDVPLYVGFGVSGPEQAGGVARHADGVIIGSALIRLMQEAGSREEAAGSVGAFLRAVRAAMGAPAVRAQESGS